MPSDLAAGPPTVRLLGVEFAGLGPEEVQARLAARPASAAFAYVVTPNADHLIRLHAKPELGALYEAAALRLLDSRVVARLARAVGLPAPPVVTGSDLTAALFDRKLVQPGEPVTILLKGRRTTADVTVLTDETDVVTAYETMARDNRQFASFNKIGLDEHGVPDPEDLRLAWQAGARAFRLTPA